MNQIQQVLPDRLFFVLHAYRYWLFTEPEARHYRDLLRPGGTAIDVGACWGAYTYLLSRVAGRVIAVEPNPYLSSYLTQVVPSNVDVLDVALSDEGGDATLVVPTHGTDRFALASLEESPDTVSSVERVPVKSMRLDDLDLGPVDFIKIDVEGHEERVLAGSLHTIERDHPDILVELEEDRSPGVVDRVSKLLASFGYRGTFRLGRRTLPLKRFDPAIHQNSVRTSIHSHQYVNLFHFRALPETAPPRTRELVRLFLSERSDPIPFHERLADDAMRMVPGRLPGARVLDIGCGPGHYTRVLRKRGAVVLPIDLDRDEFKLPGGPPGGEVVGTGESLPVATASVDGVLCSNTLEHVPNPREMLVEIRRVVRPGGWVWLSWTNWLSPWGGHEVSPWHYLGTTSSRRIYRALHGEEPKNCPGLSLFPLHVGPTLRWIRSMLGFRVLDVLPRYYPRQHWIMRLPGFREVAAWNCLVLLQRTDEDEPVQADELDPSAPYTHDSIQYRMKRTLRRAKWMLGNDPAFLPLVLRVTPEGTSRQITDRTDIVIEGFPRSGNTFAVFALRAANPEVVISSHVHLPSQVKLAVQRGVPTAVITRDPLSTIASYLIVDPHGRLDGALREYLRYYRELMPYRDSVVIARFEVVTKDANQLTRALNERYGLSLAPFEQTPEAIESVFRAIERYHAAVHPGRPAERVVPRPSSARGAEKQWLVDQMQGPRLRPLLDEADAVYKEFSRASASGSTAP